MINVIIIDDEPLARNIIKGYLNKDERFTILAECGDGFEGLKMIQQHQPDLIFLDVQMPKLTGFEMLEIIDNPPFVIFTTAHDEFALKAFEKNALDYLMKPISPQRFTKAIDKFFIQSASTNTTNTDRYKELSTKEESVIDRIVVKVGSQIKIISVNQIMYLEAYDDYVKIHTAEGMYLKNKTMSFFEKALNPQKFVRIHRSSIICIDELAKLELYEKDSYLAVLKNGTKLNISKSGYTKLKQLIGI